MAVLQTDKVLHFGDLVSAVGTSQLYPLGTKRVQDGKSYRYVKQNDATVAAVAGALCYTVTPATDDYIICGDVSDTDAALAKGVYMGVIADAGFGWIQTKGYNASAKKPATAWVKGDVLFAAYSSTSDGKFWKLSNDVASSTNAITRAKLAHILERIVGFAAAAVSSTTAVGGVVLDLE